MTACISAGFAPLIPPRRGRRSEGVILTALRPQFRRKPPWTMPKGAVRFKGRKGPRVNGRPRPWSGPGIFWCIRNPRRGTAFLQNHQVFLTQVLLDGHDLHRTEDVFRAVDVQANSTPSGYHAAKPAR
jgi:hypothetical protein